MSKALPASLTCFGLPSTVCWSSCRINFEIFISRKPWVSKCRLSVQSELVNALERVESFYKKLSSAAAFERKDLWRSAWNAVLSFKENNKCQILCIFVFLISTQFPSFDICILYYERGPRAWNAVSSPLRNLTGCPGQRQTKIFSEFSYFFRLVHSFLLLKVQ